MAASRPPGPWRVLLVEDNADLREVTAEILEDEGLDVVACCNGFEAEQLFAARPFDLLLTDLNMPELTGTELARRLLAKRPDLWVVFLSGHPLNGLESWGPRVRSVLKPFDGYTLHVLIDQALSGS